MTSPLEERPAIASTARLPACSGCAGHRAGAVRGISLKLRSSSLLRPLFLGLAGLVCLAGLAAWRHDILLLAAAVVAAGAAAWILAARARRSGQDEQHVRVLRAKEAFLSALVNNTDDLLLAVDRDLRVTMMNEALRAAIERNYGFALQLGDDVYRMVVPERRAELEAVFSRALQGERQRVESSFRLPNGRQVSQDEAYNPIRDADGRVTGVSIFVHDVSAQRRAAQTIQSIVNGTAAALGEAFFRSLVRELAAAVGTRYALVGELLGGEVAQIRTVAVAVGGAVAENFDYVLSGTPCEARDRGGHPVLSRRLVRRRSRSTACCARWGCKAIWAWLLRGASGQVLGLLAVLDDRPMRDSAFARTLLGVFAARAGAELDRLRSESEKRRALAILEEATDLVAWSDPGRPHPLHERGAAAGARLEPGCAAGRAAHRGVPHALGAPAHPGCRHPDRGEPRHVGRRDGGDRRRRRAQADVAADHGASRRFRRGRVPVHDHARSHRAEARRGGPARARGRAADGAAGRQSGKLGTRPVQQPLDLVRGDLSHRRRRSQQLRADSRIPVRESAPRGPAAAEASLGGCAGRAVARSPSTIA